MEEVRNIGIIAHIDAGKTTTTERILFYTGVIHKMGEVDEGTATMDYMIQEKERGITITSAATTVKWKNHIINIIDTPGHVDFTIEVVRSLKVLDGAVVIFDAVNGVEPQSETVWYQADKFNIPRIIFINKLDRPTADFYMTVKDIKEKLNVEPLVLQIPYYENNNFIGIIDIINWKLIIWKDLEGKIMNETTIPPQYEEKTKKYREELIEKISHHEDEILDHLINNKELSSYEIKKYIRKLALECKLFPVFCGSALKNKCIQPLLDGIVDFLPSPVDRKYIQGVNPKTNKVENRLLEKSQPFLAYAFKIQMDHYLGKLIYARIYSGEIKPGKSVYNTRKDKKERINKIFKLHADKKQEITSAQAGDIVGLIGLQSVTTGDTLTDLKNPFLIEPMKYPEPVIWAKLQPKTKIEDEKLDSILPQILLEDPTLKIKHDPETAQKIIYGMGELHLEILIDRLKREHKINVELGKPQVSYKETITQEIKITKSSTKTISGKIHSATVSLHFAPNTETEYTFLNLTTNIPQHYINAIEEGIKNSLSTGPIAGYPVTNVKVSLIDASYNPNEASDLAYRSASSLATIEALKKTNSTLLEPIMKIEILTPETYIGNIVSDLNTRRAKINNIETKSNLKIISGYVPLANMFGYATILRSLSQGRASFMLEPSHYEPVDTFTVISQQ